MNPVFRKLHRNFAPWLIIPLLVTLSTGIGYRVGKAWFGLDGKIANRLMDVHTGEWMGEIGSMIYLAVTGFGLLAVIATGATLLFAKGSKIPLRRSHRIFAVVMMLPLAASAATGLAYKFGEAWFHLPDETTDLFMKIHEGAWLGKAFTPFYVLFVGLGLLVIMVTGFQIARSMKKKSHGPDAT